MLDLNEIFVDTKKARVVLWELLQELRTGKTRSVDAGKIIAAANGIVNAHKVDLTAYHILGSQQPLAALPAPAKRSARIAKAA